MAKRKLSLFQMSCLFAFVGLLGALIGTAFFAGVPNVQAQAAPVPKALDKPPAGQTFIGYKECSSCHFDQLMTWKATKHAKGYEILPAKYQDDKSCLKCHSTGYGATGGFVSKAKTPALAGTTCEACHGPGSEHAKIAKTFAGVKLNKDQEAYVRSLIYRVDPKNACIQCHLPQGHKEHPKYEK